MPRHELNRHPLAPLLAGVYRLAGGARRRRVAQSIFSLLGRLEGHGQRSATTRILLARDHGVRIGAFSYGECFVPGAFAPGCTVGRYVSVGPGVRAYTRNHPLNHVSTAPFFYEDSPPNTQDNPSSKSRLIIGHDVWLGQRATITPGCSRIGTGAVIGAGAVVTQNVPDFAIVGGVPARVLRYRFDPPTRQALLATRWWKLTPQQLAHETSLMTGPLNAERLIQLARTTHDARRTHTNAPFSDATTPPSSPLHPHPA
ncbi:MAG: CatB-related O-acetyltransferase [Algisphaera sp.]